ncbi:MAG: FtsX-like permease family protein [Flavobacteriales bacterium]|nr:FtsX-like permease family protein [Flavobacteriales bacterium]
MFLALKLAFRNLIGAGLRTWLNAIVLSFAFVMIIFFNGFLDGWKHQAVNDSIEWEFGDGQLIHKKYDPYDPFSFQDSHDKIPDTSRFLSPVLVRQATIYPNNRMVSVVMKGISPDQSIVKIPVEFLKNTKVDFPVIIGKRMAKSNKLKKGDQMLLRWRDKNGTFDAANITVVEVFDNDIASVDNGQLWMDINKLWQITGLDRHATYLVAGNHYLPEKYNNWTFKSQEELLEFLLEIIGMEKISSSILYMLLLAIALLAIFDTQVLSIFRRQKEIGTYIAMGMTRFKVMILFTVEGAMYSFFAMILGTLYGIPLFRYFTRIGLSIPEASQNAGVTVADVIYPIYTLKLILTTILIIIISATLVSFIPARKISKMDPVAALKGKLQ